MHAENFIHSVIILVLIIRLIALLFIFCCFLSLSKFPPWVPISLIVICIPCLPSWHFPIFWLVSGIDWPTTFLGSCLWCSLPWRHVEHKVTRVSKFVKECVDNVAWPMMIHGIVNYIMRSWWSEARKNCNMLHILRVTQSLHQSSSHVEVAQCALDQDGKICPQTIFHDRLALFLVCLSQFVMVLL